MSRWSPTSGPIRFSFAARNRKPRCPSAGEQARQHVQFRRAPPFCVIPVPSSVNPFAPDGRSQSGVQPKSQTNPPAAGGVTGAAKLGNNFGVVVDSAAVPSPAAAADLVRLAVILAAAAEEEAVDAAGLPAAVSVVNSAPAARVADGRSLCPMPRRSRSNCTKPRPPPSRRTS